MPSKETTASYVELATQTYSLFVDAVASANQRTLDYAKSVWEIGSKPYDTSAVESVVRDGFDRANKIVELWIAQLQINGQKSAELAEKLASQSAKIQESYTNAIKGLLDTSISNMNYVKDTATAQFEDFTKRMEDLQKSTVSAN
jgi:hypothetical protein